MSRQFCHECGAILRELSGAWRADTGEISSADPYQLRNEWINSDDEQLRELWQTQYPRLVAARRRKVEHEVLTGHNVILHGLRTAGLGRRF